MKLPFWTPENATGPIAEQSAWILQPLLMVVTGHLSFESEHDFAEQQHAASQLCTNYEWYGHTELEVLETRSTRERQEASESATVGSKTNRLLVTYNF